MRQSDMSIALETASKVENLKVPLNDLWHRNLGSISYIAWAEVNSAWATLKQFTGKALKDAIDQSADEELS